MDKLMPTLEDYFDVAPVSLWLEDYSALKVLFDQWRAQGIVDLAAFLQKHPEQTMRCRHAVKVLRVNMETLTLLGASNLQELQQGMEQVLYRGNALEAFEPLVALWNLPPGQRSIQVQSVIHTLGGRRIDARIHATIMPGFEGNWARVLTLLEDVSDQRASEEQFRQITMQIPGVVYRVHIAHDGTRTYRFISDGVRDVYGVTPQAVMADEQLLTRFRHPDDPPNILQQIRDTVRQRLPLTTEFRIVLADGTVKWVQMTSAAVVEDETGSVRNGVILDITARKKAEAELRENEERWKLALESTGDGVWDWHIQTGAEYFSKRHQEMFGYEENELPNLVGEFDKLIHPDDLAQAQRDRQAHFDGLTSTYSNERRVRCKDGSWKWVLSRGMVVSRDDQGKPLRMIGTHTDISERKRSESLIWQQANFDALTGLPNRRMLRDRLEQDILKGRRDGTQLALLFIDLDHFKEVNDTLGHDFGDRLLIEAAHRIRECVREADTVARMGGDEFTVLVAELSDTHQLERVLQTILHSLSKAFQLGQEQVFVSASIGITMYPQDATEVESLFKNADQALYAAKGAGRNRFSFFTRALQETAQHRVRLASDLRSALSHGQLSVHYQPIVELASGAIHKAEALLRWQHPMRGFVSPAEFIPIAESTGLIVDIGEWVFQQAARQVQRWRTLHAANFQISVNRSPVQFHSSTDQTPPWSMQLLAMGLPGDALAVEITEGLLLDASANITEQLLELNDCGIQVSLDDFGTGYSSLSYLQRYDIDYLKIDQSFVRHLIPASTDLALCKAIIVMAHELGMKVVAEGVETEAQRDLLAAAGCDYAQGYLFARPMPAAEFETYLARK
jgi:diguanylate cyclase (GGDEF)-like protein/PAS domain S-box-containing protein